LVHGQSGGMPWLRCGALPFEHEHEHEHEQPISQQPLTSEATPQTIDDVRIMSPVALGAGPSAPLSNDASFAIHGCEGPQPSREG
jgi:hypothetical protein